MDVAVLLEIIKQTIMITGFVLVMMLVIEYVNVFTGGTWQKKMLSNRWSQYVFAALLEQAPDVWELLWWSHCIHTV